MTLREAVVALLKRGRGCLYCVNGTLMTGNAEHSPDCEWEALRAALRASLPGETGEAIRVTLDEYRDWFGNLCHEVEIRGGTKEWRETIAARINPAPPVSPSKPAASAGDEGRVGK